MREAGNEEKRGEGRGYGTALLLHACHFIYQRWFSGFLFTSTLPVLLTYPNALHHIQSYKIRFHNRILCIYSF